MTRTKCAECGRVLGPKSVEYENLLIESCRGFGYSVEQIRGKQKTSKLAMQRRVVAKDLHYALGLNPNVISKMLNKDRNTVTHYIREAK